MKGQSHLKQPRPSAGQEPSVEDGPVRPFLIGCGMAFLIMLPGCSIATLPVKATSKAVDWSTTSRDEADRNRGREMRKRDEAYKNCVRKGYADCQSYIRSD